MKYTKLFVAGLCMLVLSLISCCVGSCMNDGPMFEIMTMCAWFLIGGGITLLSTWYSIEK